jgi:ribosomal protein S18 acetylase RimI-like enzyme
MNDTPVSYRTDKDFDVEVWLTLYHSCDWNRDWTPDRASVMRDHAFLLVTVWTDETMVGTLTALSDGRNYATIEDVVVHPGWRHRGIGSTLVRLALERLDGIEPDVIKLNAIPGIEPFYEHLGFMPSGEVTMSYRSGRP